MNVLLGVHQIDDPEFGGMKRFQIRNSNDYQDIKTFIFDPEKDVFLIDERGDVIVTSLESSLKTDLVLFQSENVDCLCDETCYFMTYNKPNLIRLLDQFDLITDFFLEYFENENFIFVIGGSLSIRLSGFSLNRPSNDLDLIIYYDSNWYDKKFEKFIQAVKMCGSFSRDYNKFADKLRKQTTFCAGELYGDFDLQLKSGDRKIDILFRDQAATIQSNFFVLNTDRGYLNVAPIWESIKAKYEYAKQNYRSNYRSKENKHLKDLEKIFHTKFTKTKNKEIIDFYGLLK